MRALGLALLLGNCTACPASGDFGEWFDRSKRNGGDELRPVGSPDGTTYQVAAPLPRLTPRDVPGVPPREGVRAFPGAEGFGAMATGGRGGRVIYVTTLRPTGPGSLQAAFDAEGPRYILFKVSGLIDGSLFLGKGNVTVAGHTSPGGVIIRGMNTGETPYCDSECGANVRGVENVVIRHLRARPHFPGDNGLIDGDGFRFRHVRNAIFDHLSSGNALDESMEVSYANRVTIQESILAETLGGHAVRGGMLLNYSNPAAGYELDNIALLRNAWVRIQGRYPEMSRESRAAAGSTLHIEIANNLLWDQQFYIESDHEAGNQGENIGALYFQMNWVSNHAFTRPRYPWGMINFVPHPSGRTTVFFRDNRMSRWPGRTDWQLNYCCNDYATVTTPPARPSWARDERHAFPEVTYLPTDDVRRYVLARAGAFPRDPMDRRVMGYVAAGQIPGVPPNVNPANDQWATDFPANAPPAAPRDSDDDGMPDDWERAHNLDPMTDDHNGMEVGATVEGMAGYPNLEVYLAELSARRMTESR